ncbi:MAG: cation-translocating P-type ATPase C-terminal domain-containing protein, partial [Cellulosilyticum sp.]|nr:cation-translocating P-type ATPase C-terminal domain-containing protein [Cellulosilyticum sp.]
PVSRTASIVSKSMFKSIIRNGIVISLLCLLQNTFNFLDGLESEQSTILFTLFMVCQLFNAFNSRKLGNESLVKYGFNNKKLIIVLILTFFLQIGITLFGGSLFNTVPLNFMMWVKIVTVGASLIVWDEAVRWIQRKLELKIK